MKKKKAAINKEEDSENWCFICKDGGDLRICDYRECLKSYHSSCLGKDDSFLESDKYWACDWHTCFNCRKRSYLQCYTCKHAVCRCCLPDADFLRVKGQYGFCNFCQYMALLIEDGKDYDSDGAKVDFRDRETREGLFMEYYYIIKEKEGFELGDLHAAKNPAKKESESSSQEIDEEEISDYDGTENVRKCDRTCNVKGSERKKSGIVIAMKSYKNEFIGWGSRSLIEFLSSIGKSTDEELSQHNVTSIVNEYINKKKLLHPDKRKMIVCDRPLESLFNKKTFSKHRVYELLGPHFAENYDESEEDEVGYDSLDNTRTPDKRKRKRKLDVERKPVEKVLADNVPLGCFASIVEENIKLVYLRRIVILEMLKQPETFEEKVVGCFVRVKSDQYDYCSWNSHQLMKVRGVRRVSIDQNTTEVSLLFSAPPKEISVSLLSDDNFSKEEYEELRGKIFAGQLERPTVEDLQQKANIIHVDLTKHWISKELALLPNLIDQANEKGWRRELFEYLEKKRMLQDPSEVSKLLENVPKVIPDLHEINPILNDTSREKGSPNDGQPDHYASEVTTDNCSASSPERKLLKCEDGNLTSIEPSKPNAEVRNNEKEMEELKMCSLIILRKQKTTCTRSNGTSEMAAADEISNEGKATNSIDENQSITDLESSIWCLQSPDGELKKYSLSVLKRWSENSVYSSKFKVWKEDENEEENAVWLDEVLSIAFPKK